MAEAVPGGGQPGNGTGIEVGSSASAVEGDVGERSVS
jgi:hypothetical protein